MFSPGRKSAGYVSAHDGPACDGHQLGAVPDGAVATGSAEAEVVVVSAEVVVEVESPPHAVSPTGTSARSASANPWRRSPVTSRGKGRLPRPGPAPRGCRRAGSRSREPGRRIRLEVRRRDLDPEGALAHLALAEVAQQREQRPDLP